VVLVDHGLFYTSEQREVKRLENGAIEAADTELLVS